MNWLRSKITETTSNLYSTVKNWFYGDQPKEEESAVQALKEQVEQLNDLVSNLIAKINQQQQVINTLQQSVAQVPPTPEYAPVTTPEMLERRKRMQEQFVKRKEISKKLLPPPAPKYAPVTTPERLARKKRMQEQFVKRKELSKKVLKELGEKKWDEYISEFAVAIDDVNTFVNKIEQLLKDYPRLHADVEIDGEYHFNTDGYHDMHDDLTLEYISGHPVRKWISWYVRGYEFSSSSNLTQRFYNIIGKAKKYLKSFKGIKSFTIFNLKFYIKSLGKKVENVKKKLEAPKLQMKVEKAMRDKFMKYKITYPLEIAPKTGEQFFGNLRSNFVDIVKDAIARWGSARLRFGVSYLMRNVITGEIESKTFFVNEGYDNDYEIQDIEVTETTDIINLYDILKHAIMRDVEEVELMGSGWSVECVYEMDINIWGYKPLDGGSYLPTPPKLVRKQAIINIKNNDDKCFFYSLAAKCLEDCGIEVKNPDRVSHYVDIVR